MIAYGVSGFEHCPRNLRTLAHELTNHEKRCFHIVARQHFQKLQCVRIIRAIIIGEGNLL